MTTPTTNSGLLTTIKSPKFFSTISFALLIGIAKGLAFPPTPISNLTALTGSEPGSILLSWSAPDDSGLPVLDYKIRYRPNYPILTEFDWASSILYPIGPFPPAAPGNSESQIISSLTPGVTYYFAIKSLGAGQPPPFSAISNSTAAVAGKICDIGPNDGEGTATIINPSFVQYSNQPQNITLRFTAGPNGIQRGGRFRFRVPNDWPYPTQNPTSEGYVSSGSGSNGATIDLDVDGPNVTLVVSTTGIYDLTSGSHVDIQYNNIIIPCEAKPTETFVFSSQAQLCGQLVDIASQPTLPVQNGLPDRISFNQFTQLVLVNSVIPVHLTVRDYCNNQVPLGSSELVTIQPMMLVGTFQVPDTEITASTSSDLSPAFPSTGGDIPFGVGSSSGVFYYQINSIANPVKGILSQHPNLTGGPNPIFGFLEIIPTTTSAISGVSVDTGTVVNNQSLVTFTPDGDGTNDVAFINFTMPGITPFKVELSSDGFNTIIRTFHGFGTGDRISWYGDVEAFNFGFPITAPAGTYNVRIADESNTFVDQTSSITLVAGSIKGLVLDDSSVAVANAKIELFQNTSYRLGYTNNQGQYVIHGIKPGTQQLKVSKPGYENNQQSVTISNGLLNQPDVILQKAAVLNLIFTRPNETFLPQVWGHVRANTLNWSNFTEATVHFAEGKTESDAGDYYNATSSSYSSLNLAPSQLYNIHADIPGYGANDFNVTITSVVYQTVPLTRRANIQGHVEVPMGINPNGMWVSVEAGPDVNQDLIFDDQDPSKRFYGGTFLVENSTSGIHQTFGVTDTTYMLLLKAPGFLKSKINVVVSGGVDVTNADFPVLSLGGVLSGTVTINGDTTSLDSLDGNSDNFFPLYIRAWSPTTYDESFGLFSFPTGLTTTSSTFSLTGLENGTYQIFVDLQGFETSPPGPVIATVSGGVGSSSITLQEFTGSLTGTITLPGSSTDFGNVTIDLLPNGLSFGTFISTQGQPGGTYSFNHLGTGYYTLRAYYSATGFLIEKSVIVSNGQPAQENISLIGNVYTLSGNVDTEASSPFNSLDYLVNQTTPTTITNLSTNYQENIPAARIVIERVTNNNFFGGENSGGPSGTYGYDPKQIFFSTYSTNGDYSINLPEGVYRISNNAELDNNFENGNEVAETTRVIYLDSNLTEDFTIGDGYEVSGNLLVSNGQNEPNRELEVSLQNNNHQQVSAKRITLTGTSASFTLEHIPSGSYILTMREVSSQIKYVAKEVLVEVDGSDVTGKQITLTNPARIQGTLRIATSGELITSNNFNQFLSDGFFIEARANPWFQGGYGFANYPLIDSNNKFNIFLNEGTYDLLIKTSGFIGLGAIAEGKKQFIPLTIGGIDVSEGQTLDVGVIDLDEGSPLSGTILNKNGGTPLANILVYARKAGERHQEPISATSNHLGQFTLYGIDPNEKYDVTAAPRPDVGDPRFINFSGTIFGEITKKNVSTADSPLSFQLEEALGVVQGVVATPDGGDLLTPFGEFTQPGAMVVMNKVGNTPSSNPLGDIEVQTNPDGSFEVKGLVPGSYDLWALAQGYASGYLKNISVSNSAIDVGTVTLVTGAKLFGTIAKPGGSLPNQFEMSGFVAVRDSFRDIIIGQLTTDAAGNVTDYTLSGFQQNKAYDILAFSEDNDVTVLQTGLIVNEDTELNMLFVDNQTPRVLTQAKKNANGTITLNLEFTKPLRNSNIDLDSDQEADDSELDERFTLQNGAGTLTIDIDALSSDRRRLMALYTPVAGETQFTLRSDITFNAQDINGNDYTLTQDTTFYIGIGNSSSDEITNVSGGTVELDDGSEFSAQAGTFGDDSDDVITVTLSAADDSDDFAGISPQSAGALGIAKVLGLKAYPPEMASAMSKANIAAISPFGSFYDVFLPAGVSHFFPEGREASLCLAYDDAAPDPYSLNIYYYNPTTNEYLLEQQNKSVDTVNKRICVSIAHASVFTVLNSSFSILTGDAYTGELALLNFPNPFNLKQKSVTLQNPGSASAAQTIDGTMIKMSIPSSMSGDIEIQIFNVAGAKVRTLNSNASGGAHFYMEWDGRNDHGEKVASGTYIARFTIGGANERFFKMAVVK